MLWWDEVRAEIDRLASENHGWVDAVSPWRTIDDLPDGDTMVVFWERSEHLHVGLITKNSPWDPLFLVDAKPVTWPTHWMKIIPPVDDVD